VGLSHIKNRLLALLCGSAFFLAVPLSAAQNTGAKGQGTCFGFCPVISVQAGVASKKLESTVPSSGAQVTLLSDASLAVDAEMGIWRTQSALLSAVYSYEQINWRVPSGTSISSSASITHTALLRFAGYFSRSSKLRLGVELGWGQAPVAFASSTGLLTQTLSAPMAGIVAEYYLFNGMGLHFSIETRALARISGSTPTDSYAFAPDILGAIKIGTKAGKIQVYASPFLRYQSAQSPGCESSVLSVGAKVGIGF
jgi:hypothetical protein